MKPNPETCAEYKRTYGEFYLGLRTCNDYSRQLGNIPSPTSAHYYASLIFTKLCVTGWTIHSICPAPDRIGQDAHWDCASVATLTRGLVESYLMFFYLCVEECTPEEWQARWRLLNLHDHMSRQKLFTSLGDATRDFEEAKKFDLHTEEVRGDLKNTEYFRSLSDKKQKHFLRGNDPFFKSVDQIVEASGDKVADFRYMYRFLSNHAHTYPMGFYRMDKSDRGRGVETDTEVFYCSMFLEWACDYLVKARIEFIKIWLPHIELIKAKKDKFGSLDDSKPGISLHTD